MKILTLLPVTLLLLVSVASAQEPAKAFAPETSGSISFTQAEHVGDNQRSFFLFAAGGLSYSIRNDGWAESFSNTVLRRFFQLKLGRKGQLVRVQYLAHENDLFLMYELSDEQFGWGYLERFDPRKRVTIWITPINGFNLGPVLVENNAAYFGAANVLAKIDLHTGRYVWQQEEFQQQTGPFAGFRLPEISGERLVFQEDATPGRTVEVQKLTGKIVQK